MCDHLLDGYGLPCVNDKPHEGNGRGCVHESSTGSHVNDRHDDGGHG